MHKAGARIIRHMVARNHRHREIPFAVAAFNPRVGMCQRQSCQIVGRHVAQTADHIGAGQLGLSKDCLGQGICHQNPVTDRGRAFCRPTDDLIKTISNARPESHRAVLGNGPGRCGPDQHIGLGLGEQRIACHRFKPHPDHVAGVVVIFYLCLGQRGFLDWRPHDGLGALVQRPVHQEGHELIRDHGLGVVIHCQIWLFPLTGHAQTFELFTLNIDPALGEFAAFLTEGHNIDIVLVQTLGAILLFDLPFDRQAVAIPTGHIARVAAHHLLAANHHILEDLVQRVADVQMAVGVGRAVMQGEIAASGLFAQAVIDPDLLPAGQPVGFALGQACAHGKIGFGQEDGVAVVSFRRIGFGRIGAHRMRSFIAMGVWRAGARREAASRRLDQRAGPIIRDRGMVRNTKLFIMAALYAARFKGSRPLRGGEGRCFARPAP